MKYGLPENTIKAINSVFSKHQSIEKAILYGSRAKGNYKNGSDIDLTIVSKSLDLRNLFAIENELDELMLPYKIDLSVFDHINHADLIEHINSTGLIFYQKE